MWYIYMLIGLYILTPILRAFTKNATQKTFLFILAILFILTSIIPTINFLFNIKIVTFGLDELLWVLYYLLGYYLTKYNIVHKKIFYVSSIISILIIGLLHFIYYQHLNGYEWPFNIILSSAIFYLFSSGAIKVRKNKVIQFISKYSFGIYVIHALWINVIYKCLHFYPDRLPAIVGETAIFIVVLILSIMSCLIIYRLPLIKKLFK